MFMRRKRKYYMLKKTSLKAFTLIECLVSLLVISGAILVYNGLTQSISANVHYLSENQEENWLRAELANCQLDKVENNKLYVTKSSQKLAFGQSKADDFRKTNASGQGYQPMIFGVRSSAISRDGQKVTMTLTLENGLERTFVYTFETAS
mgnify:CR=1 FL=1